MSNAEATENCPSCKQSILDKCAHCNQFIFEELEEDERCSDCGQELPEEEEEAYGGYEFKKKKDGTEIPYCKFCKRPLPSCPKCLREFESEEETESSESETDENEEERNSNF